MLAVELWKVAGIWLKAALAWPIKGRRVQVVDFNNEILRCR